MTDHRDLIYCQDWKGWKDPEFPETFNPTTYLLDRHLGTDTADKTALVVDDDEYSYAEFTAEACRAAGGLKALGLHPGDLMLFFGTNSVEYLATWFGALRCGGTPVVVSDLYKAPSLLYFLRDTGAKVLFIDAEQADKLAEVAADLPESIQHIIVRGEADVEIAGRTVTDYPSLIAGQSTSFTPVARHENDVTYMFYSGGTTGTAKGITHLAHDFPLIPERHGNFWEYGPDDVVHATSKAYFTHGLWPGILIPFYWGATSVISRKAASPENVLALIESRRVTKLITVPTIIKNLLVHVDGLDRKPDFSSIKMAVSASEKMPPEIFMKFRDLFGVELFDSIGSAEVTYEWIANRPKDYKRGSLGKPVFGVEIKLVDADGNEVTEPNQDGEAWVKSRTACFFYWRKFDKTKETFIGPWTRTGDTLSFDEEGFFWFQGRSDDIFKVKGQWVSPIEVEAAITEHPAVLEAAVVSYEDTDGLTKPKAFIVLKPDEQATDELSSALREQVRKIGGYKVPEEIAYVESLPRTTLLKIDRRTLREEERARRASEL